MIHAIPSRDERFPRKVDTGPTAPFNFHSNSDVSGTFGLHPARDRLRWRHGQHQSTAHRALPGSATTARRARRAAGFPGLHAGAPAAHRDRPLRGTPRVLGFGHRDRLDQRVRHGLPRAPVAPPDALGRAHRRSARLADRVVRLDGPAAARPRRRTAAHHAGRRVGIPASGAGQAAGGRHGGGRGRLSRRGAGGGSHHRRPPRQAGAVRIVGLPRKCGWRCRIRRRRAARTGAARG